jgi:chromosome segregation ATPase
MENPKREIEKNYYESMVLSRMARIKENQDQEVAKEKVATDLEQCLSDYKAKYESIVRELQECEKVLPEKMATIQREINSLNDRLIDIDKDATVATDSIGHHGNTLIQCLTEVRILAKAINNGATAYTPLVGVLKGRLECFFQCLTGIQYAFFVNLLFSCENVCRCSD